MENQIPQESFGTLTRIRESLTSLLRSPLLRIGVILLIVAAIPLTVYVSQQQQDIRQRAAEEPTPTPQPTRVFITSTTYNGNLGGLAGADAKCQTSADSKNLGGAWKAWLSDGTTSASSRLEHSTGPYKLVNGTTIADNWTDLTDGTIKAPINIDENSSSLLSYVWTNTKADGTIYTDLISTGATYSCSGWGSSQPDTLMGLIGDSWHSDGGFWSRNGTTPCSSSQRLYCFEQPPAPTLTPTPSPTPPGPTSTPTPTPTPTPIPLGSLGNIDIYPNPCNIPVGSTTCSFNVTYALFSNSNISPVVALCLDNRRVSSANASVPVTIGTTLASGSYIFKLITPPSDCTSGTILDSKTLVVNPALTPTPIPIPPRRVFTTSTAYNGNLGGLAGADAKCQTSADSKNLGGAWKAWLSDGTTSASSRLEHSTGPYKLLNGTIIADNWAKLIWNLGIDGFLNNSISRNENGDTIAFGSEVWTNTIQDGSIEAGNNQHCGNWTSASSGSNGRTGVVGRDSSPQDRRWTSFATRSCNNAYRLYCFEQPPAPTPTPTPTPPGPTGTSTPTPTPTPAIDPEATYLRLDVALTGIGGRGGNPDPKRKQREVTVELIGANESPVATGSGLLTFDSAAGSFKGLANLGRTFNASGMYEVKVKVSSYLKKRISIQTSITIKTINPVSPITLDAGDINNNGVIGPADDYNIILFCFGVKANSPACGSNKENADLNDDGEIDGIDYNLFIRSLATIEGD